MLLIGFIQKIKHVQLPDNYIMGLDVVSLFSSIHGLCNKNWDDIEPMGEFDHDMNLTIKRELSLIIHNNYFTSYGKCYKHNHGTPIVSPT